ncbi:Mkk2p [Rhizophagus irregularis DAOM 197198w]|uniref:Mkk2p n=3 Tax=Rhizophagus irregularis TaxID=588596 RepID=A0A015K2R1_RHIIW|nr:Mkk2p [Rhizophagus irregularis DAOM 197198w]
MSSKNYDRKCKECDEQYTNDLNAEYEWCKICQVKYLENFTSGNEKIDVLIQEIQSKINDPNDILFGWIPYNQFDDVEEVGTNDFTTVYSAIWKDGPSHYSYFKKELTKVSNKKVILKCLHNNSQNIINVRTYSINYLNNALKIYGISQTPDTKDYIMVLHDEYFEKCCKKCGKLYSSTEYKWCNSCHVDYLKENFTTRISENEEIDSYIQEMQLKINNPCTIVFEWIPYDQFDEINEISKGGFATIYLAIWKDGPLYYEYMTGWAREPNKKVILKRFENLHDSTNEFLNEVKPYSIDYYDNNFKIYGISQNPNTSDYIMVLQNEYCEKCVKCGIKYIDTLYKWCNLCQINDLRNNFTNWTSKDEKIDNFIQEMQLKINNLSNIVFEWIPYNQFNDVKEIRSDYFTIYSAIWKDGPLSYSYVKKELTRVSDKKVALKPYYNSKTITNEFVDEVKKYSINYLNNILKIYGISQNPYTNDYIMVFPSEHCEKCDRQYIDDLNAKYEWCKRCQINYLKENFTKWTSGNEKIDGLIQETQLKIDNPNGIVFEWIPYNQFNEIKEIGKGGFSTVYSAIWKDGPLYYLYDKKEWIRNPNKKVALKCLHNSQNITNEFLNEVKAYLKLNTRFIIDIYGISQDLNTGNYILIFYYAEGGSLYGWLNDNYKEFSWSLKLKALLDVIQGLKEIHQKQMVHRDLHTGNLLISTNNVRNFNVYISSMELCGEVSNIDKTKIYGLMPYVAPEVLRGKPYKQAADIYSFGMIMYVIASGREPFANYAHDSVLALNICNGIRPEVNEKIAPKCYIDLMKVCWDPDPDKRPSAIEIEELICTFKLEESEEIKKQFKEAEEYRKANLEMNALPKYDDDNISISSSSSVGTAEIIDFTDL